MSNLPPIFARRLLSPVAVPFVLPWNVGRVGCYVEHGRDGMHTSAALFVLSAVLIVSGIASTVGVLAMAPHEWRVVVACIVTTLIGCWIAWAKWTRIKRCRRHCRTLRFDYDSDHLVIEDRSGGKVRLLSSTPVNDVYLAIHDVLVRTGEGYWKGVGATVVCGSERITVICVSKRDEFDEELVISAPWLQDMRRTDETQFRGKAFRRVGPWPSEWGLSEDVDI